GRVIVARFARICYVRPQLSAGVRPQSPNVNESLIARLDSLRTDFERKAGRPFQHYFCPILHRDEPATLCRGHVINQAFRDSARAWTVQRADVDGFYGSHFESEFVLLQEREARPLMDRFDDAGPGNKLRPEIRLDGQQVHYYRPGPVVPE